MSLTMLTSIKRNGCDLMQQLTEVLASMQVKDVFDDMYQAGLQPSCVTYNTLITAHAHQGNWQAALQVLQHMCRPQVPACFWQTGLCILLCIASQAAASAMQAVLLDPLAAQGSSCSRSSHVCSLDRCPLKSQLVPGVDC